MVTRSQVKYQNKITGWLGSGAKSNILIIFFEIDAKTIHKIKNVSIIAKYIYIYIYIDGSRAVFV